MAFNKGYVPNLKQMISDCEGNFNRMTRLLPDLDDRDTWRFGVEANNQQVKQVSIKVVERCKYTVTMVVAQESFMEEWVPKATITVRLYRDAHMAEVLSFQRKGSIRQAYDYPNDRMFQPDEKAQLNGFLGEWLEFCLGARRSLIQA